VCPSSCDQLGCSKFFYLGITTMVQCETCSSYMWRISNLVSYRCHLQVPK
jgi:hypothetical protein